MTVGKGSAETVLSEESIRAIVEAGTPAPLVDGKRVLVLTPDTTRTCPLPPMIRAMREVIGPRAARMDFMVALGTHPPLSEEAILRLYGITGEERKERFPDTRFYNHRWDLPETFLRIGLLAEGEVENISGGLLRESVAVEINRLILDYDLLVVLGPVFPHEVVGYSGGIKYLFPGISGGEFLHFFHWLGAVLTCEKIIGIKDTPVRRMIHRAVGMVPVPIHSYCMVVNHEGNLCGLYVGDPMEAWSDAADLSQKVHIVYRKRPFRLVLGRAPEMYDELWTAGKVMYKLEQVVSEGGRLIIFGPHIHTVSRTWGEHIRRIGYHVRDYFLEDMERYRDVPRGVLAHSTHVRGTGAMDRGREKPRIEVVLATGIPRDECDRINLGYMDPESVDVRDYQGREEEGVLFVDRAGEILYRLEKRQ